LLCLTSPLNIDYIPTGNNPQQCQTLKQNFSNLLSAELALSGPSRHGLLEDRRQRLRQFLIVKVEMDHVMQSISRGDEDNNIALMLIYQVVPCIIHLKNRVGKNLITVLLSLAAHSTRGEILDVLFIEQEASKT
jgi:hypothetical protein